MPKNSGKGLAIKKLAELHAKVGKEKIGAEYDEAADILYSYMEEFVTSAKQQRVITAAQLWLSQNPTEKQPRFDVIEVYAPDGENGKIQINHIENAF